MASAIKARLHSAQNGSISQVSGGKNGYMNGASNEHHQNGSTNGQAHENGHFNGYHGKMKGYSNGTNGQSHENGVSNGQSNVYHGKMNGYSSGHDLSLDGPHAMKARKMSMNNNHPDPHEAQFMGKVFDLLQEILKDTRDVNKKVLNFKHPAELEKIMDLELRKEGEDDNKIIDLCRETAKYSVKTGHPHFFNQLFAALDTYGLAGSLVTDALNASQYTYEVSPVFTLMEKVLIEKMCKMVGWQDSADGIFAPGGSICNLYALNLARYAKYPEIKTKGASALPPLCVFTSSQCHFSLKKSAALMGLGVDNCIGVPVDSRGKMDMDELERLIIDSIERGLVPYCVNATAATTVVGAIDPLEEVADLCEKYNMWMHVDAAWGGGMLASRTQTKKLHGIERADSVTWDPHKMMNAPMQCCVVLTKHEGVLKDCNSAAASYLFQPDKFYDVSYDTGDKSLQCSRNVDVFKLWLMWKAKGDLGFEAGIDNIFDCSEYLTRKADETEGFRLVYPEPEATNVCFWYVPPSIRGQTETTEWWNKVGKAIATIKERMMIEGTCMINYQPQDGLVNFFRMVVIRHSVTHEDMDFVINEIIRLGKDL